MLLGVVCLGRQSMSLWMMAALCTAQPGEDLPLVGCLYGQTVDAATILDALNPKP